MMRITLKIPPRQKPLWTRLWELHVWLSTCLLVDRRPSIQCETSFQNVLQDPWSTSRALLASPGVYELFIGGGEVIRIVNK